MTAKGLPGITLNEIDANLTHINTRIEKHGEEDVIAMDLDLRYDTNNDALAHFASSLKSFLYMVDPNLEKNKGETIPGVDKALTVLRYPAIEWIKWRADEIIGGTCTIHRAISGHDMVLGDCKVKDWEIEPRQGGTVTIYFRVQCCPGPKERGKIIDILEHGVVTVSIEPPAAAVGEGDA